MLKPMGHKTEEEKQPQLEGVTEKEDLDQGNNEKEIRM